MSNAITTTFKISRTQGLDNPIWMEETIHNKETNKPTVYLFQREAAKQTLWRCIKDYFKGIKSAGEQVEKCLCGTLHYNEVESTRSKITNPLELNKSNPSAVDKIIGSFETHIGLIDRFETRRGLEGSKTFDYEPHASPGDSTPRVHVKLDTEYDLETKLGVTKFIDSMQPDSKTITSSEREKIKKIAHYTYDLMSDRARPKSKREITQMLKALDNIYKKIPKNDTESRTRIKTIKNSLSNNSNKLRSPDY
jgi:hypothetical protein